MASRRAKSAMTRTRWTLVVASHALCASTAGLTLVAGRTQAARVKDLVRVAEIGSHKVIGYGLVVGLEGTGDGRRVSFTAQAVANMLEQFGLTVEPADLRLQNVAAVAVTAEVPPFARVGSTVDVLVSSIGDADSLQGGTLLMTPLRGRDDHVYVIAQGPVSLGGFAAARGGERSQKNHVAVGRAIGAGSVVRPIPQEGVAPAPGVCLSLLDPDFTTATRIAQAIEAELGAGTAKAADPATVLVNCPIADGR
ncbi:MAG: flagellar basal body P-ring protein FlgI, partial [Armatimonadota bacterium]